MELIDADEAPFVVRRDARAEASGEVVVPLSAGMRSELERLTATGLWGATVEQTAREVLARGLRETRERYQVPW